MTSGATIGILLAGGGHTHQESYAHGFLNDPRCTLVAVADEEDVPPARAQLNREFAEQWHLPALPWKAALARSDVHAVSVCVEPERRARVAMQAAEAGKHLYLDKPIATTLAEADILVKDIQARGLRAQMYSNVHTAHATRAKQLIDSQALGELRAIHCDLMFAKGIPASLPPLPALPPDDAPQRFEAADAKRELFNVGVYPLALIRFLTHKKVRAVKALTRNYFFEENRRHAFEDFATLHLTLEDGITATVLAGRVGWMDYPGSGPNFTRLVGTRGHAMIDGNRPRGEASSNAPAWQPPPRTPADPMGFWRSTLESTGRGISSRWHVPPPEVASDQSHFLDCVVEGREPAVSAAAGRDVLEVILAAYKSAATGEVVTLAVAN